MFRTASAVCTRDEERLTSLSLAHDIAETNGYPREGLRYERQNHRRLQEINASADEKIHFCLPFISDKVSREVQLCLKRAGLESLVDITEVPPFNLKHQLVRNRIYDRLCVTPNCIICPSGKQGDCMVSCAVYLIKCTKCGEEYIGETARPLCTRIKEHISGRDNSRLSTPLGSHRVQKHKGDNFEVHITILTTESNISARKTLEAFWIHARNPRINRREERPSIASDLAPYLDLCDL